MLLWACAGPVAAMLVLHGVGERFDRVSTRLRVLGATIAAVSPALFMLMRGGLRLEAWYLALGASVLLALVPWPALPAPTVRLRVVHRLSAAVLGLFILGHIVNQSLAFISVPWYAAMRNVMQAASQQSISYTVIAAAAALQIVTGRR